jgi:hypothetical protein
MQVFEILTTGMIPIYIHSQRGLHPNSDGAFGDLTLRLPERSSDHARPAGARISERER